MVRTQSQAPRDGAPALLVQLTDCHLFGEAETSMLGVNTDASLRAVLGQIEADHKRPDLVLATGDLPRTARWRPTNAWPACCRPARHWPAPASAACPATMTRPTRCAARCPPGASR